MYTLGMRLELPMRLPARLGLGKSLFDLLVSCVRVQLCSFSNLFFKILMPIIDYISIFIWLVRLIAFCNWQLPGLVSGHYRVEDCHIDVYPLAQFAQARIICSPAIGLDLEVYTPFRTEKQALCGWINVYTCSISQAIGLDLEVYTSMKAWYK